MHAQRYFPSLGLVGSYMCHLIQSSPVNTVYCSNFCTHTQYYTHIPNYNIFCVEIFLIKTSCKCGEVIVYCSALVNNGRYSHRFVYSTTGDGIGIPLYLREF
jgi:hypothetical protein